MGNIQGDNISSLEKKLLSLKDLENLLKDKYGKIKYYFRVRNNLLYI